MPTEIITLTYTALIYIANTKFIKISCLFIIFLTYFIAISNRVGQVKKNSPNVKMIKMKKVKKI